MSTDRPSWTPRTSSTSGATCQNCDSPVSKQFARVFGDNRDVVYACPACETYREMKTGAAAPTGGDDGR